MFFLLFLLENTANETQGHIEQFSDVKTISNKRIYPCPQCFYMPHFLFQPYLIDGVEFRPVRIDIHKGVVKIVDEEIHHDFEINNTECVVVGRDRKEILASLQEGLAIQYKRYGKLEEKDIPAMSYETRQAWKRMQRLI
jgi:hypothetical protein